MPGKSSLAIGQFLYKNAFPIYSVIYPMFKRWQDAFEIELLRKFILRGDTVLDIGANIGFYADLLAEIVGPDGKIYSFEPDPQNLRHLQKKVAGRKNVTIVPKAVSDKTGTLKLYISSELNVDHRTYPSDSYNNIIEIEAVAIDDYLPESTSVDFIKIDIQGAEVSALRGMEQLLKRSSKVKLLMEFWPYGLRSSGSSVAEFVALLKGYGMHLYLIEGKSLRPLVPADIEKYADLPKEKYFNLLVSKKELPADI